MNIDGDTRTSVYIRKIKKRYEHEFEDWFKSVRYAAHRHEGFLGASLFKVDHPQAPQYVTVFRFTTETALNEWESAPERTAYMNLVSPMLYEAAQRQVFNGLEYWFSAPADSTAPPHWKMTIG